MHTISRFLLVLVVGLVAAVSPGIAEVTTATDADPVELTVGAVAPAFCVLDDRGEQWSSADQLCSKYTVIYFYPADFTSGCSKQAESFRETVNELVDRGTTVIGVSGDSVDNHCLFKAAWSLNYTLLADEAGDVARAFGVPVRPGGKVVAYGPDRKRLMDEAGETIRLERKATFARWTFIVGPDGKVLYKNTVVRPAEDAKKVSEFIEQLETASQTTPSESDKRSASQ